MLSLKDKNTPPFFKDIMKKAIIRLEERIQKQIDEKKRDLIENIVKEQIKKNNNDNI
jgi:hypothetical protein